MLITVNQKRCVGNDLSYMTCRRYATTTVILLILHCVQTSSFICPWKMFRFLQNFQGMIMRKQVFHLSNC